MTRGYSLEQDLRLLVNNPKYSDIEILCQDEKKLYACRAILAARSEVFESLFYNGMKESHVNQISFPKINSSGMEIILEYAYTGLIKEESLTKDSILEAFYAADYFQLPDLQDGIMKIVKDTLEKNHLENYSPELLSKVVETMPLTEDNILLNLLVEAVATIPLNTIDFSRLPIMGLRYLLSCTYETEKPFVTPEYEVFRYSAILAAKQVSDDAYETLMGRLPTLEILEQTENSTQVENNFITDYQKVAKELEPLIKFIDFRLIKGQILADIIEPLGIIPTEIVVRAYRYMARSSDLLNNIRGIQSAYIWDESACGSGLIIENNGKTVRAPNNCYVHQSVRAKIIFENQGIFEWDVIIEKSCHLAWVGVCASKNFDYETYAGNSPTTGCVLGSFGFHTGAMSSRYCPPFGDGAKITVHLNMNKRSLAFSINGTKYPEASGLNLPSKLCPVVSLRCPGRFRIQPYRKV